jgi:ketosteroid isomerase-like protein
MYQLGAAGDFEGLKQYLAPDFFCVEAESLPYGGTYHGFDGYVKLFTTIFGLWEDAEAEIESLIADQNSVAARVVLKGRVGDERFSMPLCEVWDLRDGKIVKVTPYYFDTKVLADLFERKGQRKQSRA